MSSEARTTLMIQKAAERGVLLTLMPGCAFAAQGDKSLVAELLPELIGARHAIKAVLQDVELTKKDEYDDPLGLYSRTETAYIRNSDKSARRMKQLMKEGKSYFQAIRIAAQEEKKRTVVAKIPDNLPSQPSSSSVNANASSPPFTANRSGAAPTASTKALGSSKRKSRTAPEQTEPDRLPVDPSDTYQAALNWLGSEFARRGLRLLHYWQGRFWLYQSSKYVPLSDEDMRSRTYGYLGCCVGPTGSPLRVKKALVDNFVDAIRAASKLADTVTQPAFLGKSSRNGMHFIPFKNGLLHVRTRELFPGTPTFFNANALDFDYDPAAKPPSAMLSFLHSIFDEDAEAIETVQEWMGYCLTSDTSKQKGLMLIGPPRSGKGTFGRILARLVGTENTCAPTLLTLATQFGLQPLIGKQLAIVSDARVSGRGISAITENLLRITGEDFVSIPRKFKDDYTCRLLTRFLIMSNELPSLADSSGALASRFIIIRMQKSFLGEEDHGLEERLNAELPQMVNWALDGLDRLNKREHFIQPASAVHLVEQLDSLGSPMKEFVNDYCELIPGAQIECSVLFKRWQRQCEEQNREHAGTIQAFGKQLVAAAPSVEVVQARVGQDRVRYYKGIRLKRYY
ncbi:DNA primase family protein [Nitrosospira briensis]|uniref:DNA primase family protein n=1 Tax=Nitrosospira briensis TaxID=35799 RepID=UPI0008E8AA8C|nr:phage/plasmid primase, P4 family [Nitrosospira briensis]SFO38769.1 putative DNA primase/helicase [Nitrosospira briensis]